MSSSLSQFWQPEAQLSAWLSASFLLMTASLLFYHMTRVHSLEMNPLLSGFFSVSLIAMTVLITLLALVAYYRRSTELLSGETVLNQAEENEKIYKYFYLVIGIAIMLIELSLCLVILHGIHKTIKK